MKKILYIAPVFFNGNHRSGVEKKISYQCKAFSKYFSVYLLCYDESGVVLIDWSAGEKKLISKKKNGYGVLKAVLSLKTCFDNIYIRYPLSSFMLIRCLKRLKAKSHHICIEIATYPYFSELKGGFKNRIIAFVDFFHRRFLSKYVDRIVTFSKDDFIFGIKTIKTINGVDFDSVKVSDYIDTGKIHLIAVSSVYYLHGYDRMIEGLFNYYSTANKADLVFDIVGDGPYLSHYRDLVDSFNLNDHVVFHGKVFGDELEALYSKAMASVNSLAIHRQHLKNESTIKSKEYAAKGLPIISSSFVDSFSPSGNESFVFVVPPDDSPIDVSKLMKFLEMIYQDRDVPSVRRSIREESICVCDINVTMKPIIDFYMGN